MTDQTYTALLALPDGYMAKSAASRLFEVAKVRVVDNDQAGVWLTWTVTADNDKDAIFALQEIRLRAEMVSADIPEDEDPSLFQGTPFIIVKGDAEVVLSEEVYCI